LVVTYQAYSNSVVKNKFSKYLRKHGLHAQYLKNYGTYDI